MVTGGRFLLRCEGLQLPHILRITWSHPAANQGRLGRRVDCFPLPALKRLTQGKYASVRVRGENWAKKRLERYPWKGAAGCDGEGREEQGNDKGAGGAGPGDGFGLVA